MTSDPIKPSHLFTRLPIHLFCFSVLIMELIPFIARLANVPVRGWDWVVSYLPGFAGIIFLLPFNFIPGLTLYLVGKGSKQRPLAYWLAFFAGVGFLLWAHGTLNLSSSSTAVIALAFIPMYGAAVIFIGWLVGLFVQPAVKTERSRIFGTAIIGIAAILLSIGSAVKESLQVTTRESHFPGIALQELALSKRIVYRPSTHGRIEVLAFDGFDSEPGKEIAVFSEAEIAVLKAGDYSIKSRSAFAYDKCDNCVHMYKYLVSNGKGGFVVASSDGVADSKGHTLWSFKAQGFTRVVPIKTPDQEPIFCAYQNTERIDCYDIVGNMLWSDSIDVADVGFYTTSQGERLPFAKIQREPIRELRLYGLEGKLRKIIPLPVWASNVMDVAWPSQGHLLVGVGSCIGVIDGDGKEVIKHVIKGTSFNPYHGPDGTAVQFDPEQKPFLAVMSHGSSGYARSVLLIFDPDGRLVWQEELNKLRTILAVPTADGKGEVLLVGGMDGVIEYTLDNKSMPVK
jgi:hypothetical protein